MNNIPLTAWEQAVIVVLFIAFLGGVFAFLRWVLGWVEKMQSDQRTRWENYTIKRDEEWRGFFTSIHQGDRDVICNLDTAIKTMTEELKGLREDLHDHDQKVEERVGRAVDQVNGKQNVPTQPRKPK